MITQLELEQIRERYEERFQSQQCSKRYNEVASEACPRLLDEIDMLKKLYNDNFSLMNDLHYKLCIALSLLSDDQKRIYEKECE